MLCTILTHEMKNNSISVNAVSMYKYIKKNTAVKCVIPAALWISAAVC